VKITGILNAVYTGPTVGPLDTGPIVGPLGRVLQGRQSHDGRSVQQNHPPMVEKVNIL